MRGSVGFTIMLICFLFLFCNHIFGSSNGTKIMPDKSEYILFSNTTFSSETITCEGPDPVQWYFEKYDGSLSPKKTINSYLSNRKYVSKLSLMRGSYLDTGYYYCASWYEKAQSTEQFPKIYIFIQEETHLLAIPYGYNIIWHDSEKDEVILPCRPTSPNVIVKLFLNGTDLTGTFRYDKRIGFTLDKIGPDNYTCVAQRNNISEEQIFDIRIINLEISPALSEYTLTSNIKEGHRVFTCKGNVPVQWYFEQYDGSLLVKKNESINNTLPENVNNYTYSTSFSLTRTTYLDTGYYYCTPLPVGPTLIKKFRKIYIFVKQEMHLFAFPDDYINEWFPIKNDEKLIIIPCRPTSRDISVQLYKTGNIDVSNLATYDEKIGYILQDYSTNEYSNFTCVAKRNKSIVKQQFLVPFTKSFRISNGYSDYVFSGQNVTINCSSTPFALHKWSYLKWLVPEKMKNQSERVRTDPGKSLIGENNSIIINIQNVSVYDEGNYVCLVMANVFFDKTINFQISYDLKVIAPNETYLNLEILDDINIKIRPAGYHCVHWKVYFSAYPNVTLKWENSKGNTIETIKDKIYVENDNQSSQLFIKDLELYDSGVYKLIAYNVKEKKEIGVELLVENPPIIESTNSFKSSEFRVKFGSLYNFEFLVSGYPLPEVEWAYTNCKNNRSTVCDTPIKVQKIPLTTVTLKCIITLIVIEKGTLICNASNIFGNSAKEYSVFVNENLWISHILYSVLILLVVIIIGSVLWFIIKRKLKHKLSTNRKKELEMSLFQSWNPNLEVVEQAYLLPYDNRWEIPMDKIELGEQLGSGAFGVVYKAKVTGIFGDNTATTVALKTIKPTTDPCHTTALASELKIMTHLGRHLNIVNLLGACTVQMNKKLMLVFEYCCFGSIDRYMQKHKAGFINQITQDGFIDFDIKTVSNTRIVTDGHHVSNGVELKNRSSYRINHTNINSHKPLCTNDLLCWSYQVSKGMDYLTSRRIVHGDLATRNILLAEDNVVKICDFGLAKNMYKNEIYKMSKQTLLPIKWLSIESMRDGIFSTASDVWSFAIVLWEMFSLAAVPYPNVQLDDLLNRLVQGYRMERPIYSNSKIYDIMLDCWKTEPTERPSFSDLVVRLGGLLQECTKSEFIKLNDHHEKMYSEILPSTDTLGLLAATTRSINSLNSLENCTESSGNKSEYYASIDDTEMNTVTADDKM